MADFDLERFLNVRRAYGPSFGPDGESLSVLLDTTGVPQVWTLEEPGTWPTQRTYFDERVTFADYSPERPEIVFGMDRGGNERAQLHLLDVESGAITDLTRHPEAKHRWGRWGPDGNRFAFTSNRREEAVFDVYVQDRTERGSEAARVHEGEGWLTVSGWHPDGSSLLVRQAFSNFEQTLSVLEDGHRRTVTPADEPARYRRATWDPAGEGIYVITDYEGDTLSLAHLDPETRNLEPVIDGDGWNVTGLWLHEETGRAVVARNVAGYTELTCCRLAGSSVLEEYPTPDLPGGVAGGGCFGPDGERLAIGVSGDAINTNVFEVTLESGETERWTHAPTAGIPPERFRAAELREVESFDGLAVPGFLTLPETVPAGGAPAIVDVHGGPESQRRPSFSSLKQYFLERGYAYFEPNVRGSSGYGREYASLDDVERRPDAVADLEACRAWLADHPAIDPDRIACKGGSYGGYMVLAALTAHPSGWAAGIDVVGIANFVTFLENTGSWRRSLREAEYGSLSEDRDLLEELSPINHIEAIEAPLFVIHGENDPRVPVGEATQVAEAAREQGVPVELLVFEDEGHGISKLENRIEAYTAVADFLDEHV